MHSVQGEPHARRRREILREHPQIRSLYGHDVRTATITYAVVVAQLALACALQHWSNIGSRWGTWWVIALVAYAVGAFMAKWCGVAIHESSHNLVYPTTRQNKVFAMIANWPVLVPSGVPFRRYHMDHHAYMGIEGLDNDLPTRAEVTRVGTSALRKVLWLVFYVFFATLARGFVKRPNRWELANVALQLTVNVALVALVGWTAVGYLALSAFFGFGLHPVAGHFIHEHYLWKGRQETYSYYGPLNRLTLNLGYHTEHHDFMRVPSARLPQLRAMAAEFYDPLTSHDSWAAVMWRFVRSPQLGHHARISRTRETFARARAEMRGAS